MRFALVILLIVFAQPTSAQQFQLSLCPYTEGAYYQPNLFPRYSGGGLELADWSTGETVRTLAEELLYSYEFSWSPDCHYLVGHSVGYDACTLGLIVWDAVNGDQKLARDRFCDSLLGGYPRSFWRTDTTAVLFTEWYNGWNSEGSAGHRFIWYTVSNHSVPLQVTGSQPSFFQVYWDDARRWLWGSGDSGVVAFDTQTGTQVIDFQNPPDAELFSYTTASSFAFSQDGSKVIVSGQSNVFGYERPAMTVYDIASGTSTQVNVERNGAGAVALSPDNRYLVMGYDAIRVWDLQNLPEKVEDRLPIYRHGGPESVIRSIRFVDSTTLETTTDAGVTRWDVFSGAYIGHSPMS